MAYMARRAETIRRLNCRQSIKKWSGNYFDNKGMWFHQKQTGHRSLAYPESLRRQVTRSAHCNSVNLSFNMVSIWTGYSGWHWVLNTFFKVSIEMIHYQVISKLLQSNYTCIWLLVVSIKRRLVNRSINQIIDQTKALWVQDLVRLVMHD